MEPMSAQKRASRFLCRDAWVNASSFLSPSEALFCADIKRIVAKTARSGKKPPAVIFDLDSTLYEVCPRTHFILQEAVDKLSRHLPQPVKRAFGSLMESQVGYSLSDTFLNLGLPLQSPPMQKAWERLRSYWWDRFFSNAYLKHDRPYPFATEFVNELHAAGAHILYLTGRHGARMRDGTLQNLLRDGFVANTDRTLLRMKETNHPDDAGFKARVAKHWADEYKIIACFENEPRNLIRLQSAVPQSMAVFVDTVCSDKRTRPGLGIYRLKHFPNLT
jgi:beta-phosphoglucomutase-like phosphatase (HAD superfamily)